MRSIDGQIGYLGGMNMGQEHLDGGKHFDSWRDTQLRLVGEVALVLQAIFVTSWFNTTQEKLVADGYFPKQEKTEEFLPVQVVIAGPDSQWAAIRQLYFLMI
ncbi:MAG: cardiolipin synthase, partial [Anaerolineales bacterium]|nr:cardiolipin synthase [Anaerolineales bacterium]